MRENRSAGQRSGAPNRPTQEARTGIGADDDLIRCLAESPLLGLEPRQPRQRRRRQRLRRLHLEAQVPEDPVCSVSPWYQHTEPRSKLAGARGGSAEIREVAAAADRGAGKLNRRGRARQSRGVLPSL